MKKLTGLLLLCFFQVIYTYAKEIPAKQNQHVSDFAHILSASEVAQLEAFLKGYEDSTSTQFAVVIEASLDGESLVDRSYEIAEKWGIGKKGKDNGVLVYIAFNDHKYWVQTGYGLESRLNGGVVGEIFRRDFVPYFKAQQYYQGIHDACFSLMQAASGLYVQDETSEQPKHRAIPFWAIIIGVIIIIIIISRSKRGGGGFGTYTGGGFIGGGGFGGSSWGGSGGSSGSSWGGFGGGSFGGGGAGGSW